MIEHWQITAADRKAYEQARLSSQDKGKGKQHIICVSHDDAV